MLNILDENQTDFEMQILQTDLYFSNRSTFVNNFCEVWTEYNPPDPFKADGSLHILVNMPSCHVNAFFFAIFDTK